MNSKYLTIEGINKLMISFNLRVERYIPSENRVIFNNGYEICGGGPRSTFFTRLKNSKWNLDLAYNVNEKIRTEYICKIKREICKERASKRSVAISVESINEKLNGYNLRVVSYLVQTLELSNGLVLYDNDVKYFLRKLKAQDWNMDIAYNIDEKIRKEYSRKRKSDNGKARAARTQKLFDSGKAVRFGGKPHRYKKGERTGISPWNKGKTKETDERLLANSVNRIGSGNPMFGKKQSAENKQKASNRMKADILSGKFTPNTKNSRTHRTARYKDKSFRSSWEAAWWCLNQNYEFEKIRIPYELDGKRHIYIVDFYNASTNILVEVKPKEHQSSKKFIATKNAALEWCDQNNGTYLLIDQEYFLKI